MKLGIAALILGSAAAFAPANTGKGASVLAMTATGTETYTFTKSEEIFKEAQEVSFHPSVEAKKNDMHLTGLVGEEWRRWRSVEGLNGTICASIFEWKI